MFDTVKVLVTLWTQRWQALREDEGATAVEYAVILAVGFAAAVTIAAVVTSTINNRKKGIK